MPRSVQDFDLRGGRSKEDNLPDQNAQRLEQTAHALTTKTGFSVTLAVTLSFVDGTRTFTITPDGSTFEFWVQGVKYTKTSAESIIITDTEGLWFIYYVEGGILTASQARWVEKDGDKAFVGIVHWDATNNTAINIGYECHSHDMPPGTHDYLHDTIGTNFEEGLELTEGAGGDAGKVSMTEGVVHDESIEIEITDGAGGSLWEQVLTLPAQIPVYYRSGATDWRKYTANDYPWYDNGAVDRIHYNKLNGTWASVEATNPYYVAYWLFANNDIAEPIIAIMGQREDLLLANALDNNQIENLSFGTLPFSEMKILFRLIWKSSTAPAIAADVQDLRKVSNVPGGTYVPTPTPNLNQVCSVGPEYSGAVSSATAMKIGDGAKYIEIYSDGSNPIIEAIGAVGTLANFSVGGGESLAAILAIGNESDGANIIIDEGGDLIVYSDDKVTEKARIDGATGNITTAGTVDGVDISVRDHAPTVAGDLNHNDLANIDADDIKHLTAVQLGALHAVLTNLTQLTTRNHNDLQNIQGGADLQHLSAAQVAALHSLSGQQVFRQIAMRSDHSTGVELNIDASGEYFSAHTILNSDEVDTSQLIKIHIYFRGSPTDATMNMKLYVAAIKTDNSENHSWNVNNATNFNFSVTATRATFYSIPINAAAIADDDWIYILWMMDEAGKTFLGSTAFLEYTHI